MPDDEPARRALSVLRRKRDATRYQVLVEVADRQPAVSQREIADAIGVTAQAVSEYMGELVGDGFVRKGGRGRYEITVEGVDWLISRTDELRAFTEYVADEVLEGMALDAAIAADALAAGDRVSLSMRDGVLHAARDGTGAATAVAVFDAPAGGVVGVTDFEGLLEYDPGAVTVLSVPAVTEDPPSPIDEGGLRSRADAADRVAVAGVEGLAAVRAVGREPDITFGTRAAVPEAATRGLDVLLVAVETAVSAHTDRLREENVRYEVHDVE